MFGEVCPQCKKTSNGAASRLVKDSCGHAKCRMCLLRDEENCQQCKIKPESEIETIQCKSEDPQCNKGVVGKECEQQSVIKYENYPGVITCNGTARKPEILPIVTNGTDKKTYEEMKPPPLVQKIKGNDKVKSSKGLDKKTKRSYNNIIIPSHITILKDPVLFKCNICNRQFSTKSHIKYHISCAGSRRPFQCDICKKDFVFKSHLNTHMLKHFGNKPYSCNVCQKQFSEKSKLKRHSILHTLTKPHVCAECGKAFRSRESLKIHTLIHRGEKPYSCRVCNANFNNTSNLNKHLISHSNEKAHMCDQCGKTFKLKWALTVHHRSHLQIRPFECGTCLKTFVNNKDLQRHLLVHLEMKAYMCNICNTGFRRKDNLYRHAKNTHPGQKLDLAATTVKQLIIKPPNKPVDNPNAINVITASPACKPKMETINKPNNRTGTVINGPVKFKINTSKSERETHSDTPSKSFNLAESVNICQKILSPGSPPPRMRPVPESSSLENSQKISYPPGLHFSTSFAIEKNAHVKNIKFKLPPEYIIHKNINNARSVIVNSSSNGNWKKQASQNFCLKSLEN